MANPWFRMYSEFAHDPKVQRLSEPDQRRYMMLLCLRCSNGDVTLHETDVAFQLRITDDEWMKTKAVLVERGLIDSDNKPTAWEKRQFATDSSAARVAKCRDKKKRASNGDVTLPKQKCNAPDTDTDTDTDIKPTSQSSAGEGKPEKLAMHVGWVPSGHVADLAKQSGVQIPQAKLVEFIAHWLTQPGTARSQAEWDKALLQSAKHDTLRQASPLPARGKPSPDNFAAKNYGSGVNPL